MLTILKLVVEKLIMPTVIDIACELVGDFLSPPTGGYGEWDWTTKRD